MANITADVLTHRQQNPSLGNPVQNSQTDVLQDKHIIFTNPTYGSDIQYSVPQSYATYGVQVKRARDIVQTLSYTSQRSAPATQYRNLAYKKLIDKSANPIQRARRAAAFVVAPDITTSYPI